jgi:hypothetical protein
MMMSLQLGWDTPTRVRRPVLLPEWLDEELAVQAEAGGSTPSARIVDALEEAARQGRVELPEVESSDDEVRRNVVLEESTNERLEQWAEAEDLDFSALAARLVRLALDNSRQPA